jgi:hypothetical protein
MPRLTRGKLAVVGVALLPPPGCCLPEQAVGFHPVTIEPSQQLMLWMALRITGVNPYSPCSGFTLEQLNVRYVVLKIAREEAIALRTPISFRTPC